MIILIDNYDSFTYNLYQQLESLKEKVLVYKNDKITIEQIKKLNPSKIVISPGPGRPEESGISTRVVQNFYTKIPILGVCLGHQCIGQFFGSKIIHAKKIVHGKTSNIYHTETELFKKVKNPFKAARYHSLAIDKLPKNFKLLAWTSDERTARARNETNNLALPVGSRSELYEKEIMSIKHESFPLFGVQFHPESFLTEEGSKIMKNFLNEK